MIFDELTAQLLSEYDLFLFAITGRYQVMRAPGTAITPRAITDLSRDVYGMGTTFCDNMRGQLNRYLDMMTSLTEPQNTEASETLCGIVVDNLTQIVRIGKLGSDSYLKLFGEAHGAVGELVQSKVSTVEFKTADRSGRKWDSRVLFRTIVRDFAYQLWLDNEFAKAKAAGIDIMEAYYPDPSRNVVFSLSGESKAYPSLAQIRGQVFHPNSKALVRPYHV